MTIPRPTRLRTWLMRLIGPAILVSLFFSLDLRGTWDLLIAADWPLFLLAQVVLIPTVVLRTVRWTLLARCSGVSDLGLRESFSVYAYAILIGTITPGRMGEFIKVVHLQNRGTELGTAFFTTFFDRLLDVIFLILVGCAALSTFLVPGETSAWLLAGVAASLILLATLTRGPGAALLARLIERAVPNRLRAKTVQSFDSFQRGFVELTLPRLALLFALTVAAWGINYYAIFLLGEALALDIGYFEMASVAAVCSLVTLLPVSILGVGTRDVSLVAMLAGYGVAEPTAIALSTLILALLVGNAAFCSFSLLTPAAQLDWRS